MNVLQVKVASSSQRGAADTPDLAQAQAFTTVSKKAIRHTTAAMKDHFSRLLTALVPTSVSLARVAAGTRDGFAKVLLVFSSALL